MYLDLIFVNKSVVVLFCKIFQDWPGWKEMAAASGRGSHSSKLRNSGCKRTISDLKQYKREWCKTVNVSSWKIIYFSPGLVWNFEQDMKVLVTVILRHICYLLNIGEGKFSLSLPQDLTVKDFFSMSYTFDSTLQLIFEGKFRTLRQLNEVLVAVVVILLNNLKSFRKETFQFFWQFVLFRRYWKSILTLPL